MKNWTITRLAKELEPYIRGMIRQMLGEFDLASTSGDGTWIQGTLIPDQDKTGNRGTDSIDLQLDNDSDAEYAGGDYSVILAGSQNHIVETFGTYSVAMGFGAYVDDFNRFTMGAYQLSLGDAQGSFIVRADQEVTPGSSWRVIDSIKIRADTLYVFSAIFAVMEQGSAQSWGYRVEGAVENDGGTTSILGQTTTTIYEDDANWDVAVQADDYADELDFLIKDAGDSSKTVICTVAAIMAEVNYAA